LYSIKKLIYKFNIIHIEISMKPTVVIKPPFNEETAKAKVKAAQDARNTRNPELVAKAYTIDSRWRNRPEFFRGYRSNYSISKKKMG
jgi:nuclear transport factor 2 (NTF2) superfamily protein